MHSIYCGKTLRTLIVTQFKCSAQSFFVEFGMNLIAATLLKMTLVVVTTQKTVLKSANIIQEAVDSTQKS